MGAQDFRVTISGKDDLSTVLSKINQAFTNMFQPVSKAGQAIRTATASSSINVFNKNLNSAGAAAQSLANGVQSILPAMGSLVALGTVGGVAELAENWSHLARQILLTSKYTGISTDAIQELSGAAKMAGIDAGTAMSSLMAFNQRIQAAVYGRDNSFFALASSLNIDIGTHVTGPKNTMDVLRQVADRVSKETPTTGKTEIDMLGLTSLGPILINGTKQLDEYTAAIRRAGYVQNKEALQAAGKYAIALSESGVAIESLGTKISERLIPAFTPLIEGFNKFIEGNREVIASDSSKVILDFAGAIKTAAADIYGFGKSLGVWKDEAEATAKVVEVIIIGALARMTAAFLKSNATFVMSPLGKFMIGAAAVAETVKHPTWLADKEQKLIVQGLNAVTGKNYPMPKETDPNYNLGSLIGPPAKAVAESGVAMRIMRLMLGVNDTKNVPPALSGVLKERDSDDPVGPQQPWYAKADDWMWRQSLYGMMHPEGDSKEEPATDTKPTLDATITFANAPKGMKTVVKSTGMSITTKTQSNMAQGLNP